MCIKGKTILIIFIVIKNKTVKISNVFIKNNNNNGDNNDNNNNKIINNNNNC